MTPLVKGIAWGLAACALLYVLFVASRFLQAGTNNKAVGIGVFVVVFTQPLFWILLGLTFCGTVAAAFRHGGLK